MCEGTHNTLFYHKVYTSERNSWLITTIDDDYNSIVDPGETTQKQALLLLILAYAEKNHLSTDGRVGLEWSQI